MWRLLLILCLVLPVPVLAEHVQYQPGDSIPLALTSGSERTVIFPEPVTFASQTHHQGLFRISLVDSVAYITPTREFEQRLLFRGLASSVMYVVDAAASSAVTPETLTIHVKPERPLSTLNDRQTTQSFVTPVALFQYAAQSLFAPDMSLVEPVPGIRPVRVDQAEVPHFYAGGQFSAFAYAGWVAAGRYVTAVELRNITSDVVYFDPCRVRGRFEIASQQTSYASPQGSQGDSVMTYFISSEPFNTAIARVEGRPC